MLGIIWLGMYTHDMSGKPRHRLLSTAAMNGGMQVWVKLLGYIIYILISVLGRPLYAELLPVTDFWEACCRQNENGECNRGGFCNFKFMHLRLASKDLVYSLRAGQRLERRKLPNASKQRRQHQQATRTILTRSRWWVLFWFYLFIPQRCNARQGKEMVPGSGDKRGAQDLLSLEPWYVFFWSSSDPLTHLQGQKVLPSCEK